MASLTTKADGNTQFYGMYNNSIIFYPRPDETGQVVKVFSNKKADPLDDDNAEFDIKTEQQELITLGAMYRLIDKVASSQKAMKDSGTKLTQEELRFLSRRYERQFNMMINKNRKSESLTAPNKDVIPGVMNF